MLAYLKITGRPLVDRSLRTEADRHAESKMSLLAAISPWVILTVSALLVNAPFLPFFELTFQSWSMPVEIIPGAAEKVRMFWQAYFWILISTLLALPFLRPTRTTLKQTWQKWLRRAPRPVFAAAVFFAIAYVMNHSGKDVDWELAQSAHNMIAVLADASAQAFGRFYPAATPFLGLLGGFISGSETSSIAMLTSLHLSTAHQIGASGLLIAAASGVGGGLASVISPAKLQNASAAIDRIGEEAEVIRLTFLISIAITAVAAILTLMWAY
jgi:lactate permease